jgi:murein DD-endopeptidase MepM/ murein hydrolase activator NlpD
LIVKNDGEEWRAEKLSTLYEIKESTRQLVIQSSLWAAGTRAKLRATDIVNLAQILEYDVDFNTELHPGDSATLLVDELWKDGSFVKIGEIQAIRFQTTKQSYVAIRHDNEHGLPEYYSPEGVTREKIFLRSPIAFSQVTSGFNPGRYHPILKTRRPHNGTDFGAPSGTAVRAVAAGTIEHAAWNGGHGKFVKIDHADPYETSYSHLSKITVKNGQYVTKGQVIGHVGTTGLSTGPHLHFQVWKDGQFIDSMSADIPTTDKHIPDANSKEFFSKVAEILPKLEGHPIAFQLD